MYNIVEAQCVLYVIKIKVSAVTRKVVNILLVLLSVSVAENCHYFITKAILRPGNEDFTNTHVTSKSLQLCNVTKWTCRLFSSQFRIIFF